ncbi:MAG: MlaD family protein [Planctomycetes bacterium]|nr:MlaD family protein [Planctomycetota bacterium]
MSGRPVETAKVGLFIAVAGMVLLLFLFSILGRGCGSEGKVYHAVFAESVTGLDERSVVRYRGVPAGTVEAIGFEEKRFPDIRVSMRIRPDIRIQAGTRATLRFSPLTGIGRVELEGGEARGEELDPEEPIPTVPSSMKEIESKLHPVLDGLPTTLVRLAEAAEAVTAALDPTTVDGLRGALASVESAAGEIQRTSTRLREELEAVRGEVRAAREELVPAARGALDSWTKEVASTGEAVREGIRKTDERLVGFQQGWDRLAQGLEREFGGWGGSIQSASGAVRTAGEDVSRLVTGDDVRLAAARLRTFADHLASLSGEIDSTLDAFRDALQGSRPLLMEALATIRQAVRNLKDLVDRLRDDPSALLFSRPLPERGIPDGEGR